MKKIITISVAFSILIFSCRKKKDEVVIVTPVLKTYPEKITTSTGVTTFVYDSDNRIVKEIFTSNNTALYSSIIFYTTYNADGTVAEKIRDIADPTSTLDFKRKIFYNSNKRIDSVVDYKYPSNTLWFTVKLTYTANDFTTFTYNELNQYVGKTVYGLSADGKNTITETFYNAADVKTATRENKNYDNKFSYHSLMPKGYFLTTISTNNATAETYTNHTTGAVTNYVYTYEYDADGYTTKSTIGSNSTIYEYTKK
jgi:hypothetical protein